MKERGFLVVKFLSLFIGMCSEQNLFADGENELIALDRIRSKRQKVIEGEQNPNFDSYNCYLSRLNQFSHPGLYCTGELIYWMAKEDGLQFALTGLLTNASSNASITNQGTVFHPKLDWDPGFKLGLGYVIDGNVWDLFVNWTWYRTDADGKAAGPNSLNDQSIYAQELISRFLFNILQSATTHWNLKYNTLDFSIGRQFALGKYLGLKPFTGLRGAWLDQTYKVHGFAMGASPAENQTENQADFRGVGFWSGLYTSWHIHRYFSLFGQSSFSLFYGLSKDTQKQFNMGSNGFNVFNKNDAHSMKSELECSIGFRFEMPFHRERFSFSFDVQWEYLNWINMNRFYLPITGTDANTFPTQFNGQFNYVNGDLGLMGLTTGMKLTF